MYKDEIEGREEVDFRDDDNEQDIEYNLMMKTSVIGGIFVSF